MIVTFALVVSAKPLYAATSVSGAISTSATWSLQQSPFVVTADVSVVSGAVLTIEPGVVVYMNPGTSLFVVNGTLLAKGLSSSPIVFTSPSDIPGGSPAPGDWGQMVFQDGANDASIVEWTYVRYGKGMQIASASPTLNNVIFQNNASPAIATDLASSPSGAGLQATGNTVNGIRVPAGEISGSPQWKLLGIPYVLDTGEISVGAAPKITGITPSAVQQGQTIDAVIAGTRLAGAEAVAFDAPGVTAVLNAGASDTAIPVRITALANQALGAVPFETWVAAGRARFDAGLGVIPPKPNIVVDGITPASLRRGESKSFQVTGSSLNGASVTAQTGSGLAVSALQTTSTTANFLLTASSLALKGVQPLNVTNPSVANGIGTAVVSVLDALPKVSSSPSMLVIPPDSTAHSFSLVLSNSDTMDHTLNFNVSDPSVAQISPASVTIPAGATQATATLTGLKLGTTQLSVSSPTLAPIAMQIYVSNLLNVGASVGPLLSSPVGIDRPFSTSLTAGTVVTPILSRIVGVERAFGATSLPVGSNVGPVSSSVVGVDRPVGATALPVGSSVGPVLSPVVGVDVP